MRKFFGHLKAYLNSESRSLHERLFVLINNVMALSFTVFIITNLLTGATVLDTVILLAILAVLLFVAGHGRRSGRIKPCAIIIAALLIFLMLPYIYFSAGGIYGSAPIWFVFSALFVSMLLTGKIRVFFFLAELAVAGICYGLSFSNPSVVRQNTVAVSYIDSYAALIFLSLAISVMIGFEIRLYQRETQRSEKQRKEIEALSAAQNRFFSSMSHEIRTPINTIIGLNEMILREDVSDEVAEDAANIQSASRMLLHLINDILDMSKLESGSMVLTPVVYRVGDMLSELVNLFWERAREKGLEFHVSVAPDVPVELVGDDVRIKQILINVLNNALKYTREGSVTLSIQCSLREGGSLNVLYSVSDTGIGIKKESIPHLFTAFKRVDEEKNRRIEGSGLGLSIVKQLVDLMGGSITVNSVYTQGSTFLIELPQQAASMETVGTLDLEERQRTARAIYHSRFEAPEARVLVVDDNASNLLVVSKLLRATRVQVDTADSGEAALQMTQARAYHVIFMDHLMPEMDGVECHRRIRSQPGGKCREAKVIALTANADAESRKLYEREGFDGYLTKPIDSAALEQELAGFLPKELVHFFAGEDADLLEESIAWIQTPQRKRLIAVTTESTADLPPELMERYEIARLPHLVVTEHGVFRDGIDLESNGLLAYMADPSHKVQTLAPDVNAHEVFFAEQLKKAHNILHIALSSGVGNSAVPAALEAAASFDNVTVLDSGHLSSGQGLLVLEACRLAEEGRTAAEIVKRLEQSIPYVQTSFVADNLDYLSRAGQVSGALARFTKALSMRPVLQLRNGKMALGQIILGSRRRAWRKYIASCFHSTGDVDRTQLFITYADMTREDLQWIEAQTRKYVEFETVFYQKAAPAIAVNCGPGTFGLLFMRKEILD